MYDLTNLSESDATQCGEALAQAASGASSMEEAANKIVGHLYDNLVDSETGAKSCALVRLYKTHAYGELDPELRGFAQGILGHAPDSEDMKCLTLLGTAGEKPEWNDRSKSEGHKAIPLPSEQFVSQIPMISRLVSQFGLDVNAVIRPDPSLLADLEKKEYRLFRVFSGWPTGSRLLHPADPTSPAVTSEPKRRPRNPQIPYTPVRSWATRKGNKTLINRELSL